MIIWSDESKSDLTAKTLGSKSNLLAFLMVPFETLRLRADANKNKTN